MAKIAIIGAGWYGCHIALELAKLGHAVTIYEEKDDLFKGASGEFGIRLHMGPHYPRSKQTRASCQRGFEKFIKSYHELVIENSHSIYGLGTTDADGKKSKVNADTFKEVCEENETCRRVEPQSFGYKNLISAYDLKEPSIAVGDRVREYFRERLHQAGVKIKVGHKVEKQGKFFVANNEQVAADEIINTTCYQSLLPAAKILPDTEIVYQPCLALVYEDTQNTAQPFSFITMDGAYPCIMPYSEALTETGASKRKYIMTNGKFTIAGSYNTPEKAQNLLNRLFNDDTFIKNHVKLKCEAEIQRFWPEFLNRFTFCGWKGRVIPKLKTEREYRSAITFKDKDGMIHVIPGKVSNIFDASDETIALVSNKNILDKGAYLCAEGGELDISSHEINEKPSSAIQNTCDIQTYQEWSQENAKTASEACSGKGLFWGYGKNSESNLHSVKAQPRL